MTFGQQILATMIGATAGFIFSLCLVWLKEKWKKSSSKSFLKNNVSIEISYNIRFLDQALDDIKKCIEKITIGDKKAYCLVNYSRFARFFTQSYYQSVFMLEQWQLEDIDKLDNILITYSDGMDNYVRDGMKD